MLVLQEVPLAQASEGVLVAKVVIPVRAKHCVSFSGTSLSIGKDGRVVAFNDVIYLIYYG